MNVALDIDGTISEHPEFFALLSASLRAAGHRVIVLTYRDPSSEEPTRLQLGRLGVEFDQLVIADSLEGKGEACARHAVDLFFEDQDECIAAVPERVLVCKIRNGGNFSSENRRWLSTARLTEFVR